jgi:anti-sigma factor ChrR (cupin superfamily)
MCMGGGSMPRSTIVMPDMGAYDQMAEQQMAALRQQQESSTLLMQERLNQAVAGQQGTMQQLLQAQEQRANQTAADAQRIAALIGAPAPEKAAKAPVLGDNRKGMDRPQGKRNLRIDRRSSAGGAPGTGLNIARY